MNQDFYLYRHAWRYNLAPDAEPELSDAECRELLGRGGWMVRNTYDYDCQEKTDFWYVVKDSFGGMEELTSNVRRKVRKALDAFEYRLIDVKTVEEQGYPILDATFKDYKVKDRVMNEKVFKSYLDYCKENVFDYWGIFDKEKEELVGFCMVHLWENSCEYGYTALWPEYKNNATYPFYGLFHSMNEYYLEKHHFKYVTDSARSITEHSNIQPFFEQNFKFRKAYCKLKMRYQWWFGVVVRVLYPFRGVIPSRSVRAVLRMHGYQD